MWLIGKLHSKDLLSLYYLLVFSIADHNMRFACKAHVGKVIAKIADWNAPKKQCIIIQLLMDKQFKTEYMKTDDITEIEDDKATNDK